MNVLPLHITTKLALLTAYLTDGMEGMEQVAQEQHGVNYGIILFHGCH